MSTSAVPGGMEVRERSSTSLNKGKPSSPRPSVSSLQDDAASEDKVALQKDMTLIGGISFIVGTMIGSGIFVSPKGVLRGAGNVGISLIIWVLGGFVSMMGAISYVELGTMITKSGGEYAYLREAFHPVFGYLFAYISTVLLKPSSAAIIALTCGEYVAALFFDDGCGTAPALITKLIAFVVMISIAAINCKSVRAATQIQIIFTACKLAALAIIILGGLVKLGQGNTQYINFDTVEGLSTTAGGVALGFYSSMWAYDGWNNLNLCVEELQEPTKNLPRAIFIGIPLVTILYLLTNISYYTVLSPLELLNSPAVAVSWAEAVIPNFAWAIPLFVAMSTFGACNGSLFTSGRLVFVAAREGHMVKSLSFIHNKAFTPAPAIMFTILIALFMLIPSDIETLIDFFSFAAWMFYALVFAGLLWLRFRRPNAIRPFKVPLAAPIIALVISAFLVFAPIIDEPQLAYLYALMFIIAGLIFYVPCVHYKKELPGMTQFNIFIQLFMEVCPPPEYVTDFDKETMELKQLATEPSNLGNKVAPANLDENAEAGEKKNPNSDEPSSTNEPNTTDDKKPATNNEVEEV